GEEARVQLKLVPENWTERIALWLGLVPTPLVDTQLAYLLARTIMTAHKLNLFENLSKAPLTPDEAAIRCSAKPRAMRQIMDALVATGYLKQRDGAYALTRKVRKWLLRDSPHSLY